MNCWLVFTLITFGLVSLSEPVYADTLDKAPEQLTNSLMQIDAAASKGDVEGVMQFYSPSFIHGDGINYQTMEQALDKFWKHYPRLRYKTKVQSWKSKGDFIIAETITSIIGLPSSNQDKLALNATIHSRQTFMRDRITHQEILSEHTEVTSGIKPPKVDIKLPQHVKVGMSYYFDAIVQEPLGNNYLLGKVMQEPVKLPQYIKASSMNLESLKAGGLFKIGRAPDTPGNYWVSAVIVCSDGMTIVTRRLRVIK